MKTNQQFSKAEQAAIETAVVQQVAQALPVAVHTALQAAIAQAGTQVTPAPVAAQRAIVNGVRAPLPGGKCMAVWAELDRTVAKDKPVTLRQITTVAEKKGWSKVTARLNFYAWKRFHALNGAVLGLVQRRGADRRIAVA